MKATILFAIIAALAILAGAFSATHQQAERDRWRVESDRLRAEIDDLERRIEDRGAERQGEPDDGDQQALADAAARLSKIEAEILDNRARLVQLKSDRLVAEEYARSSLDTLRRQVRKTTEIERDLGLLQSRRLQIQGHIAKAEKQTQALAETISARQDYAKVLDQKIAELVIRREVASSRLDLAEGGGGGAVRVTAAESLDAAKAPAGQAISKPTSPVDRTELTAATPAVGADGDEDRSKGLYRFKNLSVEPGLGGPAVAADDETKVALAADVARNERAASDEWATDQYEFGRALVARGERNSGTRELNEAVLAFQAALGEWTRSRDPLRWAAAQNDLGYALALLGQRQGDVGVLEKAALACRDALQEIERNSAPLLWATTQFNLGLTLSGMAEIEENAALWQNAIEALQQSAEVFEEAGARAEAGKATRRLEDAHSELRALKEPS
jgi:hypothetical protein